MTSKWLRLRHWIRSSVSSRRIWTQISQLPSNAQGLWLSNNSRSSRSFTGSDVPNSTWTILFWKKGLTVLNASLRTVSSTKQQAPRQGSSATNVKMVTPYLSLFASATRKLVFKGTSISTVRSGTWSSTSTAIGLNRYFSIAPGNCYLRTSLLEASWRIL